MSRPFWGLAPIFLPISIGIKQKPSFADFWPIRPRLCGGGIISTFFFSYEKTVHETTRFFFVYFCINFVFHESLCDLFSGNPKFFPARRLWKKSVPGRPAFPRFLSLCKKATIYYRLSRGKQPVRAGGKALRGRRGGRCQSLVRTPCRDRRRGAERRFRDSAERRPTVPCRRRR